MRNRIIPIVALAALIPSPVPARAAPVLPEMAESETQPRGPLPFFHPGPNETEPETSLGLPGLRAPPPARRPTLGADDESDGLAPLGRGAPAVPPEPPPKPPTRAEAIEKLLGRLSKAHDADEAKGIAALVERLWMQSGSDTADLLMTRAVAAMNDNRRDVASALLDQVIALQPGWAEAWNKRATLRFLDNDDTGSMEDISHVLALEPRHFGALSGMGFILERHGQDAGALMALRRALAVYPENADVRNAVDKLAPSVEGRDL